MNDSTVSAFLLDRRQTAEVLAVSIATVDRMVRNGDLPTVRIGRSVRFQVDELQRWIKKRTEQTTMEPK